MSVVFNLDTTSLDILARHSGFCFRFKNGDFERVREVSLFLRQKGWKIYPPFVLYRHKEEVIFTFDCSSLKPIIPKSLYNLITIR